MGELKTVDEIVGDEVRLFVKANYAPFRINGYESVRRGTTPYDSYQILWKCDEYDGKKYREETIAMAEIRSSKFENYQEALEYMDDCDTDTLGTATCAYEYYHRFSKRCNQIKELKKMLDIVNIYDLHTFYISSKYRHRGISTVILQQLPEIMKQLNLADGIISAYVNPFECQDIDLSQKWKCDYFKKLLYSDLKTRESIHIGAILKKQLKKCGFSEMYDRRYYAASLEYLTKQAVERNVLSEFTYDGWE